MKKKRVVILGSGGFVSSEVKLLLDKKKILTKNIRRKDIDLSRDNSGYKLKKVIKKNDYIFFAAARAPVKNINMFIYNMKILKNIEIGINKNKIKKILYLSSDAVYSDTKHKIHENSKTSPKNLHGQMHLLRENYLQNLYQDKLCIVRPTLIYGSNDPHNGYGPNKFIRCALQGRNIDLFGKGEEKRDHIYVKDVANIISNLLINKFYGKINLATGKVYSFYSIAKSVSKNSDKKILIKFNKRNGPMPHLGYRAFNISNLKKNFKKLNLTDLLKNINFQLKTY